ncbi:putative acyl-CoA N-acyltransferase [Helianthus debilis subsp. tardiflorus]
MAATPFSLSSSVDLHRLLRHQPSFPKTHFINSNFFPKSTPRFNLTLTCSSPSSSSSSSSSLQENPLPSGKFLSYPDLQKLQFLQSFKLFHKLPSGSMLLIRVMQEQEMDMTVELLAESFAESMMLPKAYVKLLAFLVKQYLIERRTLMPHAATLIAFHRREDTNEEGGEVEDIQLAGTVEVSFDKLGANGSPPTPTPPKDAPYICNMTVNKSLRRQGIGWQLLKARYSVFKTDSILILLTLQRRKHLMCKQLPPATNIISETNSSYDDDKTNSLYDGDKNLAPTDA